MSELILSVYHLTEVYTEYTLDISSFAKASDGHSMSTVVINIKTEISTKKQAQEVAAKFGLSLSALINAYLKELIKTKRVEFSADEKPSPYLIKILKKAEKNLKEGKGSPMFDNAEDAISYLRSKGI